MNNAKCFMNSYVRSGIRTQGPPRRAEFLLVDLLSLALCRAIHSYGRIFLLRNGGGLLKLVIIILKSK